MYLEEDYKVFVKGRVSEEDESASKLICEAIIPFENTTCELWIQFPDKETFLAEEKRSMRCFGHQKEMTVLSFIARKKSDQKASSKLEYSCR